MGFNRKAFKKGYINKLATWGDTVEDYNRNPLYDVAAGVRNVGMDALKTPVGRFSSALGRGMSRGALAAGGGLYNFFKDPRTERAPTTPDEFFESLRKWRGNEGIDKGIRTAGKIFDPNVVFKGSRQAKLDANVAARVAAVEEARTKKKEGTLEGPIKDTVAAGNESRYEDANAKSIGQLLQENQAAVSGPQGKVLDGGMNHLGAPPEDSNPGGGGGAGGESSEKKGLNAKQTLAQEGWALQNYLKGGQLSRDDAELATKFLTRMQRSDSHGGRIGGQNYSFRGLTPEQTTATRRAFDRAKKTMGNRQIRDVKYDLLSNIGAYAGPKPAVPGAQRGEVPLTSQSYNPDPVATTQNQVNQAFGQAPLTNPVAPIAAKPPGGTQDAIPPAPAAGGAVASRGASTPPTAPGISAQDMQPTGAFARNDKLDKFRRNRS